MSRALDDDRVIKRASAAFGIILGLGLGSWIGCCPDVDNSPEPEYAIALVTVDGAEADLAPAWVEGSGVLYIRGSYAAIRYQTVDGTTWRVEYRQLDRHGC